MLWLLHWYFGRVVASWRWEFGRLKDRENKWLLVILSIIFTIILFPYFTEVAFSDSFWLGLSFVWSAFLAVSFAYILRNPILLIFVYAGVVWGRSIIPLFTTAKEEATRGNLIGALIIFALGVYLIVKANQLKTWEF